MNLKKEFPYKQSFNSAGIIPETGNARFFKTAEIEKVLEQYKKEMEIELRGILSYWMRSTPDNKHGGFYGRIDHYNKIDTEAPRGSVLNSRILWTFSAAYHLTARQEYLQIAEKAFDYLTRHFIDKQFGGVYWTVDFKGEPLDDKKQIYALAFAIYGLSEYYRCSKNELAKQTAIELYQSMITYSYDEKNGGYIEAFTKNWKEMDDLRLSTKDANEKKTMNTHLHVLEALTNLYSIWKNDSLKQRIMELIHIFFDHLIEKETSHLVLFFDEGWNPRSTTISYGHDIEAAWLLLEAAEAMNNDQLLILVKNKSIQLTDAAAKGLDDDGGLWYEYEGSQQLVKQKHSWPQAEAMVGFFNAWQITGKEKFLKRSLQSWHFVKDHMLDKTHGEWYWGVNEDHSPMIEEDKVGIWKCPYHNSRACMQIIRRITSVLNQVAGS